MSKSQPTAITAIHSADQESFAASTLFSQGWSVLHRALEWRSLIDFLDTSAITPDVLLCSIDLLGFEPALIEGIKGRGIKVFLFCNEGQGLEQHPMAIAMPTTALELIGLVRGSIRSPLVRDTPRENPKVRAKVLAITSPHCAAGCTTLAINLASELSTSGKRTLLVDAHPHAASVALLMGEQGLQNARGYQHLLRHSTLRDMNLILFLSILGLHMNWLNYSVAGGGAGRRLSGRHHLQMNSGLLQNLIPSHSRG
jgi:hypothetical protein